MLTTSARRSIAGVLATVMVAGLALLGAGSASAALVPPSLVAGAPDRVFGFAEYNGLLYVNGTAPGNPYGTLHSYDGTTFTQIPGAPSGINDLTVYNGKLLITAADDINDPPFAYKLYSYDGTTFTQLVTTFVSPNSYYEFGGILYFFADVGGTFGPWRYDGTTFTPITGAFFDADSLTSFGSKLYFTGDDDPTATEHDVLFSYDPATPAAPAVVVPGSPVGTGDIGVYNGVGYIGGNGGLNTFDGTTFTNVPALAPATNPSQFTVFDGVLYFEADDGSTYRLYSYSGGAITAVPNGVTETQQFFEFEGSMYYLGFPDGQPVLTVLSGGVATAVPGSPTYTFGLTEFQGSLYFTADLPGSDGHMFVLSGDVTPELAATGVDPSGFVLVSVLLLGVGAAVVLRRRSRVVFST